jgi:hypothetical protein
VDVGEVADVDDFQADTGIPRIFPDSMRATMPTEPMVPVVRMGPNTAPGSTVTSSVEPDMKSQAARSARVFDRR